MTYSLTDTRTQPFIVKDSDPSFVTCIVTFRHLLTWPPPWPGTWGRRPWPEPALGSAASMCQWSDVEYVLRVTSSPAYTNFVVNLGSRIVNCESGDSFATFFVVPDFSKKNYQNFSTKVHLSLLISWIMKSAHQLGLSRWCWAPAASPPYPCSSPPQWRTAPPPTPTCTLVWIVPVLSDCVLRVKLLGHITGIIKKLKMKCLFKNVIILGVTLSCQGCL